MNNFTFPFGDDGGGENKARRSVAGFFMASFPSVGNLLIAPGCCLVPEAFLVSRWGSGPQGVVVFHLFIYLFI